jgi:hypothetical protein
MTTDEIIALGNAAKEAAEKFAADPGIKSATQLVEKVGRFAYEVIATGAAHGAVEEAQRYAENAAKAYDQYSFLRTRWNLSLPGIATATLSVPPSSVISLYARDHMVFYTGKTGVSQLGFCTDLGLGVYLVVLNAFACNCVLDEDDDEFWDVARALVIMVTKDDQVIREWADYVARAVIAGVERLFLKLQRYQQRQPTSAKQPAKVNGKLGYYPNRAAVLAAEFYGVSLRGTKTMLAMVIHPEGKPSLNLLDNWAAKGKVALIRHTGQDYEMFFQSEPDFNHHKGRYDAIKAEAPSQTGV